MKAYRQETPKTTHQARSNAPSSFSIPFDFLAFLQRKLTVANRVVPTTQRGRRWSGNVDEIFRVYLAGGIEYPLDAAATWSYSGKDALKAPSVPAVEQFREVIEESEKAAART